MGEIQEQRYACKICNKSCVSGKSLGGHMRVHLALIAASKKAAKEKAEIRIDDDQSNSALLSEEKINDCDNNSYELRENPKKSWRISDPKHGVVSKNWNSCKECGKEFPTLRALSGHMRCHSIKNKEAHQCKKCGKGFDSVKAMFGHMKSHSKKSRINPNDSTDSLSDLENLCPVRRKRSRIRYKSTPNSAVFELEEAEEAATCLIMLSRGVRDCLKFETESSDDDYAYFGGESSCRSERFCGYDGDLMSDVEKKMEMRLSTGYAKAFTERNVCAFDDLVSNFVAADKKEVDTEFSDDEVLSVENEMNFDLAKSAQFDKDFMVTTGDNEDSSQFFESNRGKKVISSVHESDLEKNSSENEANLEILECLEKKPKYKRRTCNKIFHKMQGNSSTVYMNASLLSVTEVDSMLDQFEHRDNQLEQESTGEGAVSLESSKSKEYECLICFKVFSSGQALGGHKRAHYNGFTESKNQEAMVMNQGVTQVEDMLDLNFPVNVDEGTKSDIGINSWWIDRSREHEALVLTN